MSNCSVYINTRNAMVPSCILPEAHGLVWILQPAKRLFEFFALNSSNVPFFTWLTSQGTWFLVADNECLTLQSNNHRHLIILECDVQCKDQKMMSAGLETLAAS